MIHLVFLTLVLVSCSLNQATSQTVYHIIANSSDLCTVRPCLTLSQFAANMSQYLHSNTTLVFLPGTHYLSKVNLTLSNVVNFSMKSEKSIAQIKCTTNEPHIYFSELQCIYISNLEFIGCGGNQVKHVERFIIKNTIFKGQENSGTALTLIETNAQIVNCSFVSNRKGSYTEMYRYIGGAIIATNSTICISQSKFNSNAVADIGGAIFAEQYSILNISETVFSNNHANYCGGVLFSNSKLSITIEACKFHHNSAIGFGGGVVFSYNSTMTIKKSKFQNNSVCGDFGGIVLLYGGTTSIETSEFLTNSGPGGVLTSYDSIISIGCSNFTKNRSPVGAVINAERSKITCHGHLLIDNNSVSGYYVIYLSVSLFRVNDSMANFTFSNNLGSFMAFNSNITFSGYTVIVNNKLASLKPRYNFQEGGALTLFQSNMFFDGECNLKQNHANYGGAIYSIESKLYVNGNVTLAHNTATGSGGGVYLSSSELNCQQKSTFVLFNNTAAHKGGGLHAIRSSIKATSDIDHGVRRYSGTRIYFTKNVAKFGGGLSLEANAKLYILKHSKVDVGLNNYLDTNATIFTANSAEYGGAVYVDDDTNSGCASDTKTECFFQVLAMYDINARYQINTVTKCLYFSSNYANISGSTLYGGLLDRCAINLFAEIDNTESFDGITYFKTVSTIKHNNISIFSKPVRVCLCTKNFSVNVHHCSITQSHVNVKKGETFKVSLVAVDQIFQPLNATIQASILYADSSLAEGQQNTISAQCTNLTFSIVSLHDSENLTVYASDGPCKNAELSRATVEVHFLPCSCPIGLQVAGTNDSNCTCECHRKISQYMKKCNSHTGSVIKQPRSRAWISSINDTNQTGYLVYPNCPFDYCLSTSPPIYLNKPNGADAQCAFNRSSLLCGSCQPGLSLSLGSSRCLSCPSNWPVLLVTITLAAILAGIALVALLLVLNMTVAIGTLNGLIFYTNIVYANKSILLPFKETNFITVFVSWLNLDLGIDTCYFPGMDIYIKTWLKLAFPAYVFFLVALVIIISSYSTRFANLIGKKNPVATLATLILLSYAKLIEICFQSLSIGILEYPTGGSRKMLWLPDATVKYLSGKHIPLFITAVLILLVGLVYTALLFFWQWLLYLPKWRIFNWSRNPKIQTFIETYNTPYTPKHRYWTGLLLIARVALYLTAAANVSNNPTIALISISFVVGSIVFLKGFTSGKQYRMWSKDVLETFFHLNIFIFAILIWYSLDNDNKYQEAIAYTSVSITIILLLLIILYHVYTYTSLFSRVKESKLGRRMDRLFTNTEPKLQPRVRQLIQPPDDDINKFDDRNLLDDLDSPVYTGDYDTVPLVDSVPIQPTCSVVEVHQPCHGVPPPPKGSNNAQNRPADSN